MFDRNISDYVLMSVPELYADGRLGRLFGLRRFSVYMFVRRPLFQMPRTLSYINYLAQDGIYQ